MIKHIPLFEEYNYNLNESILIDKLFESVLINLSEGELEENVEDIARELSSGEKAAVSRGDELAEEWQLAFAYLYANDNLGAFGNPNFAESIDYVFPMKASTLARVIRKFRDLEAGVEMGENDERNILYPKIVNAWNKFKSMHINDVIALVAENASTEKSGAGDKYLQQGREQRAASKQKEGQLAAMLNGLIQSLTGAGIANAAWKAASKLSNDLGVDINKLREIYRKAYNVEIRKP
jgi:hypothetical protein